MKLKIKRLDPDLPMPEYKTAGAVGIDLHVLESHFIGKFVTTRVRTGIAIELPDGYEAQIRPRSSVSARGIIVHLGTIDQDYRGELEVIVTNNDTLLELWRGDRIAQLVICPVARADIVEVEQVEQTDREGGFGTTGL